MEAVGVILEVGEKRTPRFFRRDVQVSRVYKPIMHTLLSLRTGPESDPEVGSRVTSVPTNSLSSGIDFILGPSL
jgi:hypothetical protein